MATSFLDYHNHGFWINDALLTITVASIYKTLLTIPDKEDWQLSLQDVFKENGKGIMGFIILDLDDFLTTPQRQTFFINILTSTRSSIETTGEHIDLKTLEQLLFETPQDSPWIDGIQPIASSRILKVLDYFISLIKEELNITVSDVITYSF